jgi:hypothetical protein
MPEHFPPPQDTAGDRIGREEPLSLQVFETLPGSGAQGKGVHEGGKEEHGREVGARAREALQGKEVVDARARNHGKRNQP